MGRRLIVNKGSSFCFLLIIGALVAGCSDNGSVMAPSADLRSSSAPVSVAGTMIGTGATTANGWYEAEEIYYIDQGVEEGVTERGENDIYLIGGNRMYQANVVEHIPGESGYSPHWNVNMVNTAPGTTLADILASPYASGAYPEALFDDVEDILDAQVAGLVTIHRPGVVVLCPIISEEGAEAPGNTELPEDFPPFPDTF